MRDPLPGATMEADLEGRLARLDVSPAGPTSWNAHQDPHAQENHHDGRYPRTQRLGSSR